jgi:hypothetical protein
LFAISLSLSDLLLLAVGIFALAADDLGECDDWRLGFFLHLPAL